MIYLCKCKILKIIKCIFPGTQTKEDKLKHIKKAVQVGEGEIGKGSDQIKEVRQGLLQAHVIRRQKQKDIINSTTCAKGQKESQFHLTSTKY